ncbi:MAG: methionine aminotransferase [Bacteroidota bacterium]
MIKNNINIKSKLPDFSNSIFATMTQLAEKHKAINLSQGFPDFNSPDELLSLVKKHISEGRNQYAPMKGSDELRKILSKKYKDLYSREYHWDEEITITAGATQAIFSAITAFVCEDDEVIIIEPAFDTYAPSIRYNGGIIRYSTTTPPDFKINWEQVKRMISSRTRMIILNFPNNPTGKSISAADLDKLHRLIRNTDILVMSDEVYEHIIFDQQKHISLATHEGLCQRTLIVSSFGKSFSITGWKLGYCVAPQKLMHEFRKAHQNIVFAANHPMQMALSDYMKNPQTYLELGEVYQQKRDLFVSLLDKSRFRLLPSEATFYQLADYSNISNKTDLEFAKELIIKHGLAAVPLSAFYHCSNDHRIIRFCFAKSDETLKKAADILCKI